VGVVLLVVGLGVLGWFGYQFVGTSLVARQVFESTTSELEQQWSEAAPAVGSSASALPSPSAAAQEPDVEDPKAEDPKAEGSEDVRPDDTAVREPGQATAIMRVPAWGDDWAVPILEGTDEQTLTRGLGWYEDTVRPGEVGNFAVAGHVVTHGQPFSRLADLPMGSAVEVETADAVYTYVTDSATEVVDTDTWVLDPVPGKPDLQPSEALITLTTCADLFRSPDRDIVFGHLVDVAVK
jgi:sortase A